MFETDKFSLIAQNLFLDFVNTQKVRDGQPFETLNTFEDFLGWTIAIELIEIEPAKDLLKKWNGENFADKLLQETVKFRNILRELAESIASKREISETAIKAINNKLKKQSGFTEIEKGENGFEKRFRFDLRDPSKLLQPIAESAADFLCYGNFELLRKCESSACVLYFYDTTKNHKRRWCSMKICGNQAKAAAFYKRKKQAAQVKSK